MIVISGFTPDDKVPGVVAAFQWAAGNLSIGAIALTCFLYGNPVAGGAAAANSITPVTTPEEADAAWGARSELARMAHAALDIPGVTLKGVAVAEAGGAAAATATLTVAGSWTTTGELTIQLDGTVFRIAFGSSVTTVTLAAAAIVASSNGQQDGRLFCLATNSSGVVTFTVSSKGVRGNQHTLYVVDKTLVPVGMTVAIAGGTALPNAGVPFTGGTGTDDVTAALAATASLQCDYEAYAHNDATNMGLVETATYNKAGFDIGLLQQYGTSTNGVMAGGIAIGQTAMNDPLGWCGWVQYGPEHPSRTTARLAALYSITDGGQPNTRYDGVILNGQPPHFALSDAPNRATLKAALNASLTPITTVDSKGVIVRAINSRSLNGSTPDYRTLDHGDTTVAIRIRKELVVAFAEAVLDNPYSGPDIPGEAPTEGTLTPGLWNSVAYDVMKLAEKNNWVQDVDAKPPQSVWDPVGKRVMSTIPCIAKLQAHQGGVVVRQQAA